MNKRVWVRESAVIAGFACVEDYAIHLATENEKLRNRLKGEREFYNSKFELIRSAVIELDRAVQP